MSVLVGKKAPDFSAQAIINGQEFVEDFSLSQFEGEKYVVLFFYPKDFTFVCPTELHAFQEKLEAFEERNTQIIAVSTDTEQSHWGWLQVPKDQGGINLGANHLKHKKYKEAEQVFKDILKERPDMHPALYLLGGVVAGAEPKT